MKRVKSLAGIAVLGLLTIKGAAGLSMLPTGPVNFKLRALTQLDDSVTLKTNKTATSTNITTTTKSAVNTKSMVNKDVLRLLANSFTNLPTTITNGQLVTDGEGSFLVVTPTATNNVTSVLQIEFNDWVFSGTETVVMKSPPGTKISETETATATQAVKLTYDDSELTTRDGKHTTLTLHGLMVTKYSDSTSKFKTSFKLTGQGDGSVEDSFVVVSGTVTGSISGQQAATGGGSNFPTSGLVLFAKFSEGSGTTVADSSGNGHTGYSTNSPAWISGETDNALNFVKDSSQSVGFGDLNLAGSNQCTFSMWFQKTNAADVNLAALGSVAGTYNAIFLAWWTDGYVYGGVGFTNAFRIFYAPVVLNTWIHFAMVYDGTLAAGSRINIFTNGVQATESGLGATVISTSIDAVSTNFSLSWDSNEGYESGRYDGVGVWDRALNATEIQQVYSNAAAGP